MIDRKIAPEITAITQLDYLLPEKWMLSNGLPVWGINAGSQDLLKIDFIFDAGAWHQSSNLVAGLTNAFLNQGTEKYSAQEIAEIFDFRGAYLQLSADQQFASVTILTLNKYIEQILEVTADVIQYPTFPDKEIKAQIGKKKQQFIIENNKVKTLAQKRFSQVLFGEEHPYANTNKFSDYDLLDQKHFIEFHQNYYQPSNCKVILAGKYNNEVKISLEKFFGSARWVPVSDIKVKLSQTIPSPERQHFVEKSDALQSAIRMGAFMPNREHADFNGLNVLVTILGGYFGSRLMTNIREEKGYTYGIGAGIYSMPNASFLSISTEVGADVCSVALNEIYYEIERLQTDLVSDNELDVVRNYLLGENLRSFDGVFAMSGSLRTLLEAGMDYDHFDEFVNVVNTITPTDLRELAIKYFDKNQIYEIVAGQKIS
ncbi:MAG: M16 family metallopeptidase [Prolixibacteraceae bacterium]